MGEIHENIIHSKEKKQMAKKYQKKKLNFSYNKRKGNNKISKD